MRNGKEGNEEFRYKDSMKGMFIGEEVRTPLFADPVSQAKSVKLLPVLHKIHTIKPNRFEAEALTKEADPEKAAKVLRETGVKNVFISLGREGCYVSSDGFEGLIPALPAAVKNTTGAGDAMMAGLIRAYLSGMDSREAALFAMAAGTVAAESEETISEDLSYEGILHRIQSFKNE